MTNLVTNWVITRLGDQRQPLSTSPPPTQSSVHHLCIMAASLVQNCCIISQSSDADQRTIRTSSKEMDEHFDKSKSGPRKFCIILVKQPCHSSIFCGIQGGDWFYLSHIKDTTMDHLYICILKEVLRKGRGSNKRKRARADIWHNNHFLFAVTMHHLYIFILKEVHLFLTFNCNTKIGSKKV